MNEKQEYIVRVEIYDVERRYRENGNGAIGDFGQQYEYEAFLIRGGEIMETFDSADGLEGFRPHLSKERAHEHAQDLIDKGTDFWDRTCGPVRDITNRPQIVGSEIVMADGHR